jgi:hypothetical protein
MESRICELNQYLTETVRLLDSEEIEDGTSETAGARNPHLELIDFNKLQDAMKAVMEQLEGTEGRNREQKVVRQWFIERILAFQRGCQAVLRHNRKMHDIPSLEGETLTSLIRIFEEESARLRSTAAEYRPRATSREDSRAEKYRPFKS